MSRVRTLIVDDSATMRSLIAAMLRGDPQIEVVGEAGDPLQAREAIKKLDPDVVTLDIEMPNMNGLEFLEKIMRLRPTPVVMVSTLTQAGAEATLKALEIGAVDCVAKPNGDDGARGFAELAEKVKAAARAKLRASSERRAAPPPSASERFTPEDRIIAIGASTGGVEALLTIISRFPANCPPTVITQHMPATFTKSFAERMNRSSAAHVSEASDGATLEVGRVYLAPGGLTHLEVAGSGNLRCRLVDAEPVNGHRPSVDVLFNSVAKCAGAKAVGAILTGMGRDGARGLKTMRDAGAQTIAQDEATCVVYGMPKAAVEIGAATRQASLERMAPTILSLCNAHRTETH
jgi:two-component system, chemotaxis family, protein-glutamate methylesterase/glutaminase